jgi:hypothetical protein
MPNEPACHSPFRCRFVWLLAIGMLMLLIGCAATPKVDPKLISQYQAPVPIGEEETLIYVIRQNTMLGAAQHLWVACNDRYYANLMAGQYCCFKVPAGVNTVNMRQMQVPFGFYRVDFRPEETVFLYFEMTKGKVTEVDADLGKTIVMKFKKAKDVNPEENTDVAMGLMNPGFVNLPLMKDATMVLEPAAGTATVTFIRSQGFAKEMAFGIWNQDRFLGSLTGKSCFAVELPAGDHTFVANSRYHAGLKAELEAGKRYYVLVEASMGWSQANLDFSPVQSDVAQSKIDSWIGACAQLELDTAAIDDLIRKRLDAAFPYVQDAVAKVQSGEIEAPLLAAADGR